VAVVQTVVEVFLNGLQQGAIFALLGIGLTIILGTMKFLNLAHGALYLIGGYAGMVVVRETSLNEGILFSTGTTSIGFGLGFVAAVVLVPVVDEDGRLVGVVSRNDVSSALTWAASEES